VKAASTAAITATAAATTTATNGAGSARFADNFLHYDADYQVLICKEHGYTLQSLSTHLRDQHSIPAKARKATVEEYRSCALLDPTELSLPPPFGPPFNALAAPIRAFLCDKEECSFVSKNRGVTARHCNHAHGWHSSKEDRKHWTSVQVQTFFVSGGFQRYFIVHIPEEPGTRRAAARDREGFVAMTLAGWVKSDEDHARRLEVADAQVARMNWTAWFNHTG